MPELAPPEGPFARIEASLDNELRSVTLRAHQGDRVEIGPGIRVKVMHRDMARGRQTILLEAVPGAVHPAHMHDSDVEIFVVSGDLTIDGEELLPGDFHFSPKGSRHRMETTRQGCTCVITTGI